MVCSVTAPSPDWNTHKNEAPSGDQPGDDLLESPRLRVIRTTVPPDASCDQGRVLLATDDVVREVPTAFAPLMEQD